MGGGFVFVSRTVGGGGFGVGGGAGGVGWVCVLGWGVWGQSKIHHTSPLHFSPCCRGRISQPCPSFKYVKKRLPTSMPHRNPNVCINPPNLRLTAFSSCR